MRTASVTDRERREMLTALLRGVSRSFYLTMRALPGPVRGPIGLAYLLARTADTIADTATLPPDERLARLLAFRAQSKERRGRGQRRRPRTPRSGGCSKPRRAPWPCSTRPRRRTARASAPSSSPSARVWRWTCERFRQWSRANRRPGRPRRPRPLHLPGRGLRRRVLDGDDDGPRSGAAALGRRSVRGGGSSLRQALQLTNVLRDTPRDLRKGRCYMPADELAALGGRSVGPAAAGEFGAAWPVAASLVRLALEHYAAAESYILAIPRRALRLRLAALWPALIGLRTLETLARNSRWLDPAHPAKISRGAVYRIMARSFVVAPSNRAVHGWMRACGGTSSAP